MEDQLFSPNAAANLFDLPLPSSGPIGFSPSIDMTTALPLTFGDGFETPAFMLEVQRKRADTVTTLKPDFEFSSHFACDTSPVLNDVPQRPRVIQRLSLTPSVASSAASTASEFDYSGIESDADHSNVASPTTGDDTASAAWNGGAFASIDTASDSIQAAFGRIGFQSPQASVDAVGLKEETLSPPVFSFHEFIEDPAQAADNEVRLLGTVAPMVSPVSPLSTEHIHMHTHGHGRGGGSESSLGLFGSAGAGALPMQHYTASCFFASQVTYPMVLSQSAPEAACFHPHGSPCPSSPGSNRSSSPYPNFGMPSVLASPQSRQIQIQHIPAQAPGFAMLPKGMSLYSHFAQLANPYAGLITKRSRGRRVPNKPEEMNNLGKSGKVYTCKVPGCGKCFKRSEHLKRHVRSIHTDEKPFLCPYPSCNKRFSRHDNLNQHARVHTSMGGVGSETYDTASVHPMSHPGMPLSHPMVLTAGPPGGTSIAPGLGH